MGEYDRKSDNTRIQNQYAPTRYIHKIRLFLIGLDLALVVRGGAKVPIPMELWFAGADSNNEKYPARLRRTGYSGFSNLLNSLYRKAFSATASSSSIWIIKEEAFPI